MYKICLYTYRGLSKGIIVCVWECGGIVVEHQTSNSEVLGSIPILAVPCCVLEQGTLTPQSTGSIILKEVVALSLHD